MITRERFDLIKKNWGEIASWAVWNGPFDRSKLNVGDLNLFEDEKILNILNPEVILVGLNISRDDLRGAPAFTNFHSKNEEAQEFKLRYVLKDTGLWGGYLTDIIKDHPDINSQNVLKKLKKDPSIEAKSIESFKSEITDLGVKEPLIIALGKPSYEILQRNFNPNRVVYLTHFSHYINLEKYKAEVANICKLWNLSF
jgi:hypothetical protein